MILTVRRVLDTVLIIQGISELTTFNRRIKKVIGFENEENLINNI